MKKVPKKRTSAGCWRFTTGIVLMLLSYSANAQVTSQLWGVSGEAWNTNGLLRDFTDVGYMSGDVAIPDWPVGVNVTNFGAVANDGIDDSQAFIDAIAACPSNHAVFVPNGRYQITRQLRVERDYFVLRGEDMYETVLFFPKNLSERYPWVYFDESYQNTGFFYVNGGTHRSIENLSFEFREQTKMGHWEWRGAYAMRYEGDVEDSWIRNIYFKNVDAGIEFSGAERISVLNLVFDHYIGRPDFIGSSGITRWVGHAPIGMGGARRCLFHNIEFKGKYFHDFDIINVPSYCVISSVRGTDMALHNHGQGANHNLYTEVHAGEGTRIFGALTDTQRVHHETYWNIDSDSLIDPASFTDCTGSNVFVGVNADYATEITTNFYYENIDPAVLSPSNIYLAQMAYFGKPLPEGPPPQPPAAPELTGDVRILNPTDDITAGSDPLSGALSFDAYLKFDLSGLQDLSSIEHVRLRVCTMARKPGTTFTLSVASVADDSWSQDTLTTTNKPAIGSVLDSVAVNDETLQKWFELDVTSFVQAEWGGDQIVSLYIGNDKPGTYIGTMHSREDGNAPQLVIERVASSVPGPPSAPTGVQTTSENGHILIDWDDNSESDFASYNVYRTPAPNSNHPIAQGLVISDFTDVSAEENRAICEMPSDAVFFYTITAVDNHGYESVLSTKVVGTTLDPSNSPPAFVSNTIVLPNAGERGAYNESLVGSVTDPESDQLYFFKISGPAWLKVDFDGTLSGIPQSSDSGTNRFTVQVNARGGRDQAELVILVDADVTAPGTPAGLAATAEDGSVRLNWNDNSEADLAGYSLYRSTNSGFYGSALATNLTESAYLDFTVSNGTTYYYVVTAADSNGNVSAASPEVSATPEEGLITYTVFLGSNVSGASNNWISTADNWDNGLPVGRQGTISTNAAYDSNVSHDGYSVLHTAGTISRNANVAGFKLGAGSVWVMDGASAAFSSTRGLSLNDAQFTLNQGTANLTDNNRDTSVTGASASLVINGGSLSVGRNLILNNGAQFTMNGGTLNVTGTFYTQNFVSSAGAITFNGGTTTANALDFDKNGLLTFGGTTTGSVTIATTYSVLSAATVSFDWLTGTKMALTISGEDEWAATEWAAGHLTYNGAGFNTLGDWAMVTSEGGLGGGANFSYDSTTETLTLVSPPLASGFYLWALSWGTNDIGGMTNDFEPDGLINWVEYALGGNPLSNDASGILPTWSMGSDGGSNWLFYVYKRREGASDLTYTVWSGTNLAGGLSNAVPAWSVSPATNGYQTVTHRIPTADAPKAFMQLELELAE